MIRHKMHVGLICGGAVAAITGAALYGVGIVGIGIVLLFLGIATAAIAAMDRSCRLATV